MNVTFQEKSLSIFFPLVKPLLEFFFAAGWLNNIFFHPAGNAETRIFFDVALPWNEFEDVSWQNLTTKQLNFKKQISEKKQDIFTLP